MPKIAYPDWLHRRLKAEDEKFKQKDMKYFFQIASKKEHELNTLRDIEEVAATANIKQLSIAGAKKQEEKAAKDAKKEAEAKYAKIEECPSPEEDFPEWLKY